MLSVRSMVVLTGALAIGGGMWAWGGSGPALPPDIEETVNLLSNASFEEGEDPCPSDWYFVNQCEKTEGYWERSQARSGRQCVAVKGDGGLAYGRWMTAYRVPIKAGGHYQVGFWYKGNGGAVYLLGNECRFDSGNGVLTETLSHAYQTVAVKTAPSTEWRYYSGEFNAPAYPSWARVCLSGGGRESCWFDDVRLVPDGLHLVQPRGPILCTTGALVTVELRLEPEDKTAVAPFEWTVATPGLKLVRAESIADRGTWMLTMQPSVPGTLDLVIKCHRGDRTYELTRSHFLRAHGPLGSTFAFSAFTDAHLYRPGVNERNTLFGKFTALVNALDPLFVLGMGDQMEISSGSTDLQKKIIAEAVRQQLDRLNAPVFLVPGNHEVDKTFEGAGTRWYHEKYLGSPWGQSFEVEGFFFAGLDVTVTGIYGRDHGGGFVHPGQALWLERALRQARQRGLVPILWSHIPVYGEFPEGADRDDLLRLIYSNGVRVVLSGHIHNDQYGVTRNPFPGGRVSPPWPKLEPLNDTSVVLAKAADPANTFFLTTTTVSAFLLGGCRRNGFLHVWVRDGRIVWLDTLPLDLTVERDRPEVSSERIRIRNGDKAPVLGLPLGLNTTPCRVSVVANGRTTEVEPVSGAGAVGRWIQVDVPAGEEVTVWVNRQGVE